MLWFPSVLVLGCDVSLGFAPGIEQCHSWCHRRSSCGWQRYPDRHRSWADIGPGHCGLARRLDGCDGRQRGALDVAPDRL
ncbi:hypothetical protein F4823DRAFT_574073 [Ustulina deusta]|nr:hypothetical protein F4823DRAFT_574073 [Ustulina deusta]